MTRKAILTGFSGQDGSYLAEQLLANGCDVLAWVRPGSSSLGHASQLAHRVRTRSFPIDSQIEWEAWLRAETPDEFYHLGGASSLLESWEDSLRCTAVNYHWTNGLLEAIRRASPETKFLFACSSEVFGSPDTAPQNEYSPFRPTNPYGISKAAAHWLVQAYRQRYSLFACSAILFNHESPRRDARFVTRKITKAVAAISAGREKSLQLGSLSARRDWGFAGEYVGVMRQMLALSQPEDFVVGSGRLTSVERIVEIAFSEVGLDWRAFVELDPNWIPPANPAQVVADTTKAQLHLKWSARVPVEEVIRMMLREDCEALKLPETPKNDISSLHVSCAHSRR